MMKKVLLIGKLTKTVSYLNTYLSNSFRTQVCTDSLDIVSGMLKLETPDLVVICLTDAGDFDNGILDLLRNQNLPLLLAGTAEVYEYYNDSYDMENMDFVIQPIVQSDFLRKCHRMTGIPYIEKAASDDWGIEMMEQIKRQILIVDDSPLALRSIKAMLDKTYDVIVAKSGERALQMAKEALPDLVLLNYEMPGWDGRKTLEVLRNDAEIGDIPVVFLTGVADKEHIAAVLSMKPQGYLLKPVDRKKLLDTIKEVFGE